MANLKLTKDFQGETRSLPEGFTVNIDDVLLDDILSGKHKAKTVAAPKAKAVEVPVKDKMIKGGDEKIEKKKTDKSWSHKSEKA